MMALSVIVIASTVTGLIVGTIWPGPITGLILPVSLTAWWLLYRRIREKKCQRSPQ
jgi:uncharacterized membrane protein